MLQNIEISLVLSLRVGPWRVYFCTVICKSTSKNKSKPSPFIITNIPDVSGLSSFCNHLFLRVLKHCSALLWEHEDELTSWPCGGCGVYACFLWCSRSCLRCPSECPLLSARQSWAAGRLLFQSCVGRTKIRSISKFQHVIFLVVHTFNAARRGGFNMHG